MYLQLFYLLPVYIEQWVDTTGIYNGIAFISPRLAAAIGTVEGTISPEMITNIDAFYIVVFQIMVSTLVMKFKPINSMIAGFLICSFGIGLWFITQNGVYLFISILIFAFGEMASSPKILEYIGRIAPENKKALYMGCYFVPMAFGNIFAGIISGEVYGRISDKITLIQKEVAVRGLDIPAISDTFTKNDYTKAACKLMEVDEYELTQMLWNSYNPSQIWIILTGIGVGTVVLLFLYNRLIINKNASIKK